MLSRNILYQIQHSGISVPDDYVFNLPEKVLQFGTGVLLRGLPDYFIDQANRMGIFNGRIVVVKSTSGTVSEFEEQDGLYTLHVKGITDGRQTDQHIICSAISRALSAEKDWDSILKVAHNPQLKVVISNTTEVGIDLVPEQITTRPPVSYPGKLLAVLYERFNIFDGTDDSGLVIIPTELIVNNGKKLKAIVLELAAINQFGNKFIKWLGDCNFFCDSLVDRIVPGKPDIQTAISFEKQFGYQDQLSIIAEEYCLWAIEGNEYVQSVLSFSKAHEGVKIIGDIEIYRELKLRLLNGTHTLCCAVAYISGFETVKDAMSNPVFSKFMEDLMLEEIAPAIPYNVDQATAANFTYQVLDRFRNPDIAHQWLSISAQYSPKLKLRVIPLLLNHYHQSNKVPARFAFCFASFIRFMKVTASNGIYSGSINGSEFLVNDKSAEVMHLAWLNPEPRKVVDAILKDVSLWGSDLTLLPGFAKAVSDQLIQIEARGTQEVLETLNSKELI